MKVVVRDVETGQQIRSRVPLHPIELEVVAASAYSEFTQLHEPKIPYSDLPDHTQEKWRRVGLAVVGTLRERVAERRSAS